MKALLRMWLLLPVWAGVATRTVATTTPYIPGTKGCIVTLAFGGFAKVDEYNKTLVLRNKSVRDHLYTPVRAADGTVVSAVADVIVFHEGNIWPSHQTYIQAATPDMPVRFVNISAVFADFHVVNNPLCPPSVLSDPKNTPPGYNSMCYFWFVAFRDYVKEYDWMLRFDDDCVLNKVTTALPTYRGFPFS